MRSNWLAKLVASVSLPLTARGLATATMPKIPEKVLASLPGLYDTALHPLEIALGTVTKKDETVTLSQAVVRNTKAAKACVAFVVRRAGWALCREHGQQLSKLASEFAAATSSSSSRGGGVSFIGMVKETNVDDEGLAEFYRTFFTFPIYQDAGLKLYESFGNRSIFSLRTWNPYRIYRGFVDLGARIKQKNIEGNMVGEGIIQGGVMVFDSQGKLQYAQEEMIGNELDVDSIRAAIDDLLADRAKDDAAASEL